MTPKGTVFDEPMCRSSGVSGLRVDALFIRFPADLPERLRLLWDPFYTPRATEKFGRWLQEKRRNGVRRATAGETVRFLRRSAFGLTGV